MALTPSTLELQPGTPAPAFTLPDARGKEWSFADFQPAPALVVIFACNHCPYVLHLAAAVGDVEREYRPHGVRFVAINPNDAAAYPADAPEHMPAFTHEYGWEFPYLVDASQDVAKAYYAACTPDFYVFDADAKLAYAGQFDGSRPRNSTRVTGKDLRHALDTVLVGGTLDLGTPSAGCNIKWKPGSAPAYYG